MTGSIPLAAWTTFLDPLAAAIVLGGTLLAAVLRGPLADARAAGSALVRLGRPGVDLDRARAEVARAERIAVTRGLLNVDLGDVADPDARAALAAIVDGAGADAVAGLLADRADARERRHRIAQSVWMAAAEAAPAMGMIGTLVGLVRMFGRMDDPSAIGGAMAVALLTTLYGALLANLVAAPVAARLARLSDAEREARAALAPALVEVARRFEPAPKRARSAA